ncbi:MAG: LAGLIDADG family homing endonuclease [Candidatus Brockarchaeota archaeon]|nr:LAGLIDADG family homing endonuclease [Candidatus Brockarchaeota archaeon]
MNRVNNSDLAVRKGWCGFDGCKDCYYFVSRLCRGCSFKMCLIARCQKGFQYTGITSPRAYYLWSFNIKGPEHYEFHPPTKYLDEEGKRAYLRGFFSGDGNVTFAGASHSISISSTCREGLEELKEMLIELGFHSGETGI